MGTLITLHAHPDDEAISTGGTMARASDEGHRVVLVVATNGDHGEVPDDLADGESLVDRRRSETDRSAAALGIHRVAWLDYADSGMTGWEQNGDDGSFHQADLDDAAQRFILVKFLQARGLLETGLRGDQIIESGDDSLGDTPAQGEFDVVSGGPHGRGDDGSIHEDLEWFLDRDMVAAGSTTLLTVDAHHAAPVDRAHATTLGA